jgi:hypothetical protein
MDKERIKILHKMGWRSKRIAKYFRITEKEVLSVFKEFGLTNAYKDISAFKDEIIKRYQDGENPTRFSKEYGVGMKSIYVRLKEWGVICRGGHRYHKMVLPSLRALGRDNFNELYSVHGMKWFRAMGYGTIDINTALWYYGLRAQNKKVNKNERTNASRKTETAIGCCRGDTSSDGSNTDSVNI